MSFTLGAQTKLMSTREQWNRAWAELGVEPPSETLFDELIARYTESQRAYHTLEHLCECFEQLDVAPPIARHPAEVELAIWFHDSIYNTQRADNEEASAEWAQRALHQAGAASRVAERVGCLILATKHDATPVEGDAPLVVDVDLSILGAPRARFEKYESQIRREYSWVPETAFREGRQRIVRGFLDRPNIYCTTPFRTRLEEQARCNLEHSLSRLGA